MDGERKCVTQHAKTDDGQVEIWRYYLPNHGSWLEGWALFLIDSTGYFSVISDYGNFAYRWTSFGDDFRAFLAQTDMGYILRKIAKPAAERGINIDKTADAVKSFILEQRRTQEWDKERARIEWDLVEDCMSDADNQCGFEAWANDTTIDDYFEFAVSKRDEEAVAFCERVWPRFQALVREQLEAENTMPPPAAEGTE